MNVLRPRPPGDISCGTVRESCRQRPVGGFWLRSPRRRPARQEGGWLQVGAGTNWPC